MKETLDRSPAPSGVSMPAIDRDFLGWLQRHAPLRSESPAAGVRMLASSGPLLDGNVMVRELEHRDSLLYVGPHSHHRLAVPLQVGGALRIVCGDDERVVDLRGGEVMVVPATSALVLQQIGAARVCLVNLGSPLLHEVWSRRAERRGLRPTPRLEPVLMHDDPMLSHLMLGLHEGALRSRRMSGHVAEGVARALCSHLIDHYCDVRDSPGLSADELNALAVFLRGRADEPCGVDEAAVMLGMAERRFLRALRASTGETFAQYHRRIKLQHAYDLLHRGELSVTEVGLECGFADPAYFSRAFTRQFGLAPSVVRRARTVPVSVPFKGR